MRELKFRAWDGKKMFVPAYISSHGHAYETDRDVENGRYFHHVVIMQWTGLKDKNGVDIFEDDILEIEGATAKVVFWERPPEFGLDYYHNENEWCEDWNLTDDCDRMEVVGNIHQHKHLLK